MSATPDPESVKRAHRRQRAAMLAVLPVDRPDLRDALESIIEEDGMTWEAIGSEIAGLLSALKLIVKEGDLWVCRWEPFIAERRRIAELVRSSELIPGLGPPAEKPDGRRETIMTRALRAIANAPGGMDREELDWTLGVGRRSADNALCTLVRRGYVDSKSRKLVDGRRFVWTLTKAGRDALSLQDRGHNRRQESE